MIASEGFKHRVDAVVAGIPKGRVMSYGQIAGLCGNARAARIVGGIAHYALCHCAVSGADSRKVHGSDEHRSKAYKNTQKREAQSLTKQFPENDGSIASFAGEQSGVVCPAHLPWHRVVNKRGGLASGYPGGRAAHAQHLASEGVESDEDFYIINFEQVLWTPKN